MATNEARTAAQAADEPRTYDTTDLDACEAAHKQRVHDALIAREETVAALLKTIEDRREFVLDRRAAGAAYDAAVRASCDRLDDEYEAARN